MWNTGCSNIANTLPVGVNILDAENQHLAVSAQAGGTADFRGVIFPWCVSTHEVHVKAFRCANMNTGNVFMYLFQDYGNNRVYWSVNTADPWGNKAVVTNGLLSNDPQEPLSDVDIVIMPDKVTAFAATAPDQFAAIATEASQIAQGLGAVGAVIVAALG